MTKKIIILSIIAFFVVVGGAVGTLWLINNKPWSTSETKVDPTVVVPDLAEDFGACQMLTKDQISSALGSVASDIGAEYNSGRIFSQGGTKSQFCRYALGSNEEINNFKSEVIIYADQGFADSALDALKSDDTATKIQLSDGDGYYYEKIDESTKTTRYEVTFVKGMSQYTLSITQPTDSTAFDTDSATSSLTSLANEAKLE